MGFPEKFVEFRDRLKNGQAEEFTSCENVEVAGRTVALKSSCSITSERRILGVVPAGEGHAHEHRLLVSVPVLDERTLLEWWRYGGRVLDTLTHPDDTHSFTIISLILAVQSVECRAVKKLKRYYELQDYKARNSGWASLRAAVVELDTGKIYTSRDGAPLKNILRHLL